ncbi:HAD family hydrolase [Tissierella sp. Yu-01]|uniref:HAD family hydrolase n=1 Tax=Tissierella sp. Yu-01 TaxID=3035694 RepID=UPI00240D6764|nr:HAD family hydrolase [Tissierella sp. Yu-01]WFA10169.1 HAD family hydrolase [Tissierella sp. Yu-01]
MNKYKGIIFDLDGTLLNTIEDISDSVNMALMEFEFPTHTYEEYKLKLGNGFRVLIEKSVPQGSDKDTIDKVLNLFTKIYKDNYHKKTKPYSGIIELLKMLDKKGYKLAINSNKRDDYTNSLSSKIFSQIPFVAVFGERREIPKKPNPTSTLEIIELMGLNNREVLFVGDSDTDILTANNAKVDSIGVTWGFRTYEELKNNGAAYIVSNPIEILNIVEE